MPDPRLVTSCLEQEISTELRRQGIVIWLDRDEHYTDYVDDLVTRHEAGDFPYPVVPFRGSFLEMMLALEGFEGGLDRTPLLIHMPGYTEDIMRGTPLLDLYMAGVRYRKALDTLIRDAATGHLPPDDIEHYLATKDYTLAKADAWLSGVVGEGRVGLAGLLDRTSLEVVVKELLIKDTFLADHFDKNKSEDLEVLRAYLERQIGMTAPWMTFVRSGDTQSRSYNVLTDALASWILCVEYVDDLTRVPHLEELRPLSQLPRAIISTCRELAHSLREQHPDAYESRADQAESHLGDELRQIRPEDLGRIDTFRTEEARILEAAIDELISGDCTKAADWAQIRAAEVSFWLGRDQRRKIAWSLVGDAALLGCLIDAHPRPFEDILGFDDAAERYAEIAHLVDHAHRCFEQRHTNLLSHELPHFFKLKEVVTRMRARYNRWADDLARDFSELCRKKGFLPDDSLQQRNIYEQVVQPLTQGNERIAVFLVDALRYEMAAELEKDLSEAAVKGTKVTLRARFAELPTITSVGMNTLAPVSHSGRLTLAGKKDFKGFTTGEFTVNDPESRARAMGQRSIGVKALMMSLSEVCEIEPGTLKNKVAQSKGLVLVHGREIDEAGEAGVGLSVFEQTLGQIKAALHHLKGAGVGRFVITSDHGFLLCDGTGEPRTFGKMTDPSRRHVLSSEPRAEEGLLTVSLSELGYDGRKGYLLFNEGIAVFDTRAKMENFIHGGNSPQERIIPVLTMTSKVSSNVDLAAYKVIAEQESDAMGCHRVKVRLEIDKELTDTLQFARSAPVELSLRAISGNRVRAMIKDVTGHGAAKNGRLQIPVGNSWAEVFFSLEGPEDERVRVEVHHPDAIEKVAPCQVDGWYDVEGKERMPTIEPPEPQEWMDALPDDGTRQIFVHLREHGVITEKEAIEKLGSVRNFRRFSNRFEEFLSRTPLRVTIEQGADGKRYVRRMGHAGRR